jgi:hypothetical protein
MSTEIKKDEQGVACFSSVLTPQQTRDIMCRAGAANKADFVSPDEFPSQTTFRVGIVIRNLQTGEETLITQPTFPELTANFSTDWILSFVDHPVFRHFDFTSMRTAPYLESPLLQPGELCTSCIFQAGREETLQALAFLACPTDTPDKKSSEDLVTVQIYTPALPISFRAFNTLASHHLRRVYALQHAFVRLAISSLNVGVSSPPLGDSQIAGLDAYTNSLYMHDTPNLFATDWNTYKLKLCFSLPATEKTAGSSIIPVVLASLNFLLPALDAKQDVAYDILQPHKSSYYFRFRNLAGWRVLGAVNGVILDFPALNQTFDKYATTTSAPYLTPNILTLYPPHPFVEAFTAMIVNGNTDARNALLADLHGHPAIEGFRRETFTNRDVAGLEPAKWQRLIACVGLSLIKKYLGILTNSLAHNQKILLTSNTLAARVVAALSQQPTTTMMTNTELSSLVLVFFRFCKGLARQLVYKDKLVLTGAQLKPVLNTPVKADEVTISLPQALSFWATCQGNTPETWPQKLYVGSSTPFEDSAYLASFMLLRGHTFSSAFELLFPHTLISADALGALIHSAHNYHPMIQEARNSHARLGNGTKEQKLVNALAYSLFTGSIVGFP